MRLRRAPALALGWALAVAGCIPVVPPAGAGAGAPAGGVDTGDCFGGAREAVARLVDRERASRGLPALAVDLRLARAAQAHAEDQARHDTSGHEGSDGSGAGERAERAGYRWRVIAENVAAGQPDAASVTAAWMRSPGHRANILADDVAHVGVGYATNPSGRLGRYWVVLFGNAATPPVRPADGCHP